ncbi:somatostatin receptor type 2-like [Xenia sp. Carnegie-2017]|uniref:somatostatin receptor type 2-like n=1 Tax=Xenia sp. Carnegie-2017 TaxID=2897299 RepID=UPI001F050490|nr:somatostatin receptor type 2-like [Xenia sp. Carnegie-2017]
MIQPRNAIKRILYCNLLWSHYILFSFGITSIYTCLVLTIERWIAVSRPLYARKYKSTRWHKIMWLALPWIVGFSLEANIVNEIQIKHYDDGYFSCQWRTQKGGTISAVLATISFLGGMIAPLFIISVMYVHILITLRRKKTMNREVYLGPILRENTQRPTNPAFYKIALNRTIRMAACATFAVLICWLPSQTYSLIAQIGYARQESTLHQLLNLLAFFNSCLNPALYAFTNRAFRKRFYHLFTRIPCQEDSSSENISL